MTASGSLLDGFGVPQQWAEPLLDGIRQHNSTHATRLAVLDDDPLGGQCVHGVPVLTAWRPDALAREIEHSPMFLLVTNTRALNRTRAVARASQVGAALREAELAAGRTITPVWRSDSTLRGHYWWEMQALYAALRGPGAPESAWVFLPYFGEAGRFTLNDTQYAQQDGGLVPVAETEFARDPAFAYTHSHLPSWLEAHSEGRFQAAEVVTIGLEDLRRDGPARVAEVLTGVSPGRAVVVNAAAGRDLEVFIAGLQQAEVAGRRFLCSGAAPFIRVRAGIESRPLFNPGEMSLVGAGGLIVVGSYVGITTAQLRQTIEEQPIMSVELDSGSLADAARRGDELRRIASQVSSHLAAGQDVVLHTPRAFMPRAATDAAEALSAVVSGLDVRPRYLLVKGGSTASHLATEALGVRRAMVLGQLVPGVPVWRLGEESRWPGLPFVIFPGNVGATESLAEAIRMLHGS